MACWLKYATGNSLRNPVLSVSARQPLRDARLPGLQQGKNNHLLVISMGTGLKEKLNNDLRQALKAGDKVRVSVIRLVLSAVGNAEIARQASLEDGDILGIMSKEARQRQESIVAFKQGNRPDLVAQEEAEFAILQEYLPRQMTRDEIIADARLIINEVSAKGPSDKGKVMPKLIAKLKGKADGHEINAVVTELLQS